MSTLAANNITDAAGTGGPTLSNGLTIGTSPLAAPSGSAPSYTCRAWVNFNGTTNVGGFCTIRESGNVSSVADNGTGDYTVNFTTAMSDANYIICSSGVRASGVVGSSLLTYTDGQTKTTTSVRVVNNATGTTVLVDNVESYLAIFR
jgi:hypothetical protein